MNLQYFPMDRQLCHIEIESCKYATRACTYIHIYTYIYIYIYILCIQTKYDFAEFNILAYVISLLDILTHTLLARTIMEVKETFPCTSTILLLRMTIDSPYLSGVNHRRVHVLEVTLEKNIVAKDFEQI